MSQMLGKNKKIEHDVGSSDVFLGAKEDECEHYHRNSNMNHLFSDDEHVSNSLNTKEFSVKEKEKEKEKISQLTIRVQVPKSLGKQPVLKQPVLKQGGAIPEITIYNIPRILMAVCAVMLLLLSIVYFVFQNEINNIITPYLNVDQKIEAVGSDFNVNSISAEDVKPEPLVSENVIKTVIPEVAVELSEPAHVLAKKDIQDKQVSEAPLTNNTSITENPLTSSASLTSTVSDESLPTQVILLSEKVTAEAVNPTAPVSRAQFSYGIEHREPVDIIKHVVQVTREDVASSGLTKVFFFSELMGLKGQKISHQWFYGDELQTTLTFNVGGNRWRVNSSKKIISSKTGIWRVDVVNEQGDILTTKAFDYRVL